MRNRLTSVKQLTSAVTEFIFPPTCANCKKVGALLCADCNVTIIRLNGSVCACCGRPQRKPTAQCQTCRVQPAALHVRAAAIYKNPLDTFIHQLKYNQQFALAKPLSRLMAQQWPTWPTHIDALVPIPLHPNRKRERGFNQSTLLAEGLGRELNIPVRTDLLQRIRETTPQVGLTAETRRTNMHGAFAANKHALTGLHILLIDDVYTTGATMSAAAEAMRYSGVAQIFGYCIARAVSS